MHHILVTRTHSCGQPVRQNSITNQRIGNQFTRLQGRLKRTWWSPPLSGPSLHPHNQSVHHRPSKGGSMSSTSSPCLSLDIWLILLGDLPVPPLSGRPRGAGVVKRSN